MKEFIFKIANKISLAIGIAQDKILHFSYGLGIDLISFCGILLSFYLIDTLGFFLPYGREVALVMSFLFALYAAFYKEKRDDRDYGGFDYKDALATMLGSVAAKVIEVSFILIFT